MQIDIAIKTAAAVEAMADSLNLSPDAVVEECVALATAHPELMDQWLNTTRFRIKEQ